jgi:hypothetical protein
VKQADDRTEKDWSTRWGSAVNCQNIKFLNDFSVTYSNCETFVAIFAAGIFVEVMCEGTRETPQKPTETRTSDDDEDNQD